MTTISRHQRRDTLLALYAETRARTERLAAPLTADDQQMQSMPDASPTKWHRAHTTWFFEAFVLVPAGVEVVDRRYAELFNSYYEAAGPRHPRPKRGLLSRPTVAEVTDYRRVVDARIAKLLGDASAATLDRALPVLELGVAHEEQHQELILTDILHAFSESPLRPAYAPPPRSHQASNEAATPVRFVRHEGGLHEVGAREADTTQAFAFDNERPRHKAWVEPFEMGDRLVTVGELCAFIREGGYQTPSLWLSDGLDFVRAHDVSAPLYSRYEDGALRVFTLGGERVADDAEPASHLSYYEADALARFLGARLPTETEWEIAASDAPVDGNFVDSSLLRPTPAPAAGAGHPLRQLFGDVWEWTRSSYEPYPGYQPPPGALGEYNGKFMLDQRVLRGGSCLTPRRHARASYRNFWRPPTRFQMTGVRLAREAAR